MKGISTILVASLLLWSSILYGQEVARKPLIGRSYVPSTSGRFGRSNPPRTAPPDQSQRGARASSQGPGTTLWMTHYDYITNGSVPRNIINYGDGTLSIARMASQTPLGSSNSPDRGTFYTYFNGSTWSTPVKIEGIRAGWGTLAEFKDRNGTEAVISHDTATYTLMYNVHSAKGTGSWTQTVISSLPSLCWPRIAIGAGSVVHVISTTLAEPARSPFYFRSTDAGSTFAAPDTIFSGIDETSSADGYAMAANGTTVAVVQAGLNGKVVLAMSTDNGVTWNERMIFNAKVDTLALNERAQTPDGSCQIAFDNAGAVHIVWGNYTSVGNSASQPVTSYALDNTILHWSSATGITQVAQPIQDPAILSNATTDMPGVDGALVTMPSVGVDALNNLFVVYQGQTSETSSASLPYCHLYATYSTNGGVSWATPTDITPTSGYDNSFPSMASLVDNNLHIVYNTEPLPGNNVQRNHVDTLIAVKYLRLPVSQLGVTLSYPSAQNLTASLAGGAVKLLWQNGGGTATLKTYRIYRGMDSSNVSIIDSASSTSYFDSVLYAPPIVYYRVSAVDTSGHESNLTAAVRIQNGILVPGNAVQLNASWIDVSNKSAVDASQIFTLEAWIYQTSIVPNDGSRIIDNDLEGSPDSWTFDLTGGNHLRFISSAGFAVGQTSVSLNQWHHVAAVVGASTIQIFLDGKLDGTGNRSGTWKGVSFDIRIGSFYIGPNGTQDEYFYGSMDEVRMWNRALSQRELQSRIYRPLTGAEPNLAAYFTMDQSGSGAFVDVTNNCLNANRTNDGVTHSNGTLAFNASTAPISQIASLSLNTAPIDFGPVKLNTTKNLVLPVKALLGPVRIQNIAFLHGTFGVTPLSAVLNPGDSVSISLSFNPTQYGSYADTLTITSNASSGNYSIPVSASSPRPTLILSSPSVQLNSATYGDTLTQMLQIRQNTVNPLTIDSLYTMTSTFSVNLHAAIVNDSANLKISFKAPNYGKYVDTVFIHNNSATPLVKVPLTANVPFPVVFTGGTLNFGDVAVGDSSSQLLLLGNTYQGTTVYDSIYVRSKEFRVSPGSGKVKPTDTLQLLITFRPDGLKRFVDTVFLQNKGQNTITRIALLGAGASINAAGPAGAALPTEFSLSQNYPNPFNPSTTISVGLPRQSHVSLVIYDNLGRQVAVLVHDDLAAGSYSFRWSAGGLASGMYVYRMIAVPSDGNQPYVQVKKLLLLK